MPEVRPIDANALKEKISKGLPAMSLGEYIKVDLVIRSIINEQLTLDYEPVVHAHWEYHSEYGHLKTHYCSNCRGILTTQYNGSLKPYCPDCGAKMDEEALTPKDMTREEMLQYSMDHPFDKISHPLFTNDEYLYNDGGPFLYDEQGALFENWNDFDHLHNGLRQRNSGEWLNGWYIKESARNADG